MTPSRSGVVGLLLALPVGALAAGGGCGSLGDPVASDGPETSTGETRDATPSTIASPSDTGYGQPPSTAPPPEPAEPAVDDTEPAEPGPSPVDGLVAGTDSSTPVVAAPPAAALQARLVEFGLLYLAFDYRAESLTRLAAMRPLVAPALLDQLARPMPPALAELVQAQRRIVEPEFLDVVSIGGDVYQVTFAVATSADGERTEELRTLTVTVDGDQRVSDVR